MHTVRAGATVCALAILAACSGNNATGGTQNALPGAPMASPAVPSPSDGAVPQAIAPETSMQPQTATPTPMPTIYTSLGKVVGLDDQFSPVDADTPSGGNGGPIDGLPCSTTMYGSGSQYHIHVYLGLLVNGKQIAIPDAIGMYHPGTESNGVTNSAQCYYPIHTHDAGGYIHIEANSTAPYSASLYTLGYLLDIWGEHLTSTAFGPFAGTTTIFYATTTLRNVNSGTYVQYTGTTPRSLHLSSHEAVWIEVGSVVPASRLPKIHFYSEY